MKCIPTKQEYIKMLKLIVFFKGSLVALMRVFAVNRKDLTLDQKVYLHRDPFHNVVRQSEPISGENMHFYWRTSDDG